MKYFLPVLLLVAVAFYIVFGSLSSHKQVNERNGKTIDTKSNTQLMLNETLDAQNNTIDDSKIKLEQGYKTEEYYLYDMSIKCLSFVRNNIRTRDELDEFLANFPDMNQTFDLVLTVEMQDRFENCKQFLDKKMLNIDADAQKELLDKAVEKKDPSALALKAYDEVFFNKKTISSVKAMLVESLVTNNPEALFTLSMFVKQFSEIENGNLVGAALMSRACDAGYEYCGHNSLMVQQTCQEESICGSNVQETIRMSVPNHLINEFENTLVEINYIRTNVEWDALLTLHFVNNN